MDDLIDPVVFLSIRLSCGFRLNSKQLSDKLNTYFKSVGGDLAAGPDPVTVDDTSSEVLDDTPLQPLSIG